MPETYTARFIVDDECGPRGVFLHEIHGADALVSWLSPLTSENRDHFTVPAAGLHETYRQAEEAAIQRKRDLMGLAPSGAPIVPTEDRPVRPDPVPGGQR